VNNDGVMPLLSHGNGHGKHLLSGLGGGSHWTNGNVPDKCEETDNSESVKLLLTHESHAQQTLRRAEGRGVGGVHAVAFCAL
jgi:hypothetical protein